MQFVKEYKDIKEINKDLKEYSSWKLLNLFFETKNEHYVVVYEITNKNL